MLIFNTLNRNTYHLTVTYVDNTKTFHWFFLSSAFRLIYRSIDFIQLETINISSFRLFFMFPHFVISCNSRIQNVFFFLFFVLKTFKLMDSTKMFVWNENMIVKRVSYVCKCECKMRRQTDNIRPQRKMLRVFAFLSIYILLIQMYFSSKRIKTESWPNILLHSFFFPFFLSILKRDCLRHFSSSIDFRFTGKKVWKLDISVKMKRALTKKLGKSLLSAPFFLSLLAQNTH